MNVVEIGRQDTGLYVQTPKLPFFLPVPARDIP